MKTKLCTLLGIEYPIVLAPMAWIGTAEVAAAVSEAGGLGTIGPCAGMQKQKESVDSEASIQRFKEQILKIKKLTSKPFAVNIPVGWGKQRIITDMLVDIAIEEQIPIVVVSMGSSKPYTGKLKGAGIKVIHAVGSVEHAKKAESSGVDAVVCEGYEAGGHLGGEELPLLVLIPQIADNVNIPVIAGGGIVDERGIVAAFALGAHGVYMGTRFMATEECIVHANVKNAILNSNDTSTCVFARKTGISRCYSNKYTEKHKELEAGGAEFEELRKFERTCSSMGEWNRVAGALIAGNIEEGSLPMGAGSAMIKEILTCKEVILRVEKKYKDVIKSLNQIFVT